MKDDNICHIRKPGIMKIYNKHIHTLKKSRNIFGESDTKFFELNYETHTQTITENEEHLSGCQMQYE